MVVRFQAFPVVTDHVSAQYSRVAKTMNSYSRILTGSPGLFWRQMQSSLLHESWVCLANASSDFFIATACVGYYETLPGDGSGTFRNWRQRVPDMMLTLTVIYNCRFAEHKAYINKSVINAKKADRTAYDVRYSCTTEPPTGCISIR